MTHSTSAEVGTGDPEFSVTSALKLMKRSRSMLRGVHEVGSRKEAENAAKDYSRSGFVVKAMLEATEDAKGV